ncbi:MAG: hypothetical protein WBA88_11385 [Pseudaminobacter sp.]
MKRILAVFAFLVFMVFCAIVVGLVPRVDLTIVILIGLVLAAYDIWDQLFRPRRQPPPSVGR